MGVSTGLKYIAKLAGVSPSTVSRVINEKPGVTKVTRERILDLIKLVGYTPNLLARGLVANKVNAIGVVIPRTSEFVFSNPFYTEVLRGIGRGADSNKYHLLLSFAEEGSYASMYRNKMVSGIIVLSNRLHDPKMDELANLNIPTVLIPGLLENSKFPSVDVDNVDGAFLATQHLISLGHRNIAFLCGDKDSKYCVERLAGFKKAFRKDGISINEELIIETDFSRLSGYHMTGKLLRVSRPPTAILCINDATAIGALSALRKNGLSIPGHISLVGFGDTTFSEVATPPLTTVKEPFYDVGTWSVKLLIDLINARKRKSWNIILPVTLTVRSSTRRIN